MQNSSSALGVILCLFCCTFLFAQEPDTLWTKTYGGGGRDLGWSVQQTNDGGYIIAGETTSFGPSGENVYLVKTDANGDTLWTQTYGGTANDRGYSVEQTADSGYIIVGSTYSYGAGDADVYLIKTDANGNVLWFRTYGGTSTDFGRDVQQTADNGYIIAGRTESYGAGIEDFYVIKTDANGDTLWTRTYGGSYWDYAWSVQQTNDGGYIVAGHTYSYGAGSYDFYLVKTDSNGDTLWTKTYGGTGSDYGTSVQQTADNGYIIAGRTESYGAGSNDFYLVKTDANGDTLWTKTYGGTGPDFAYAVQQTPDNGYIVGGQTNSFGAGGEDVYLVKTDANGDTLWTRTYGGIYTDICFSLDQTADSGYIVAGRTDSYGAGGDNFYVLRIAVAGAGAVFSVTPTSVDFGNVPVDSSKTDSVTVTNTGGATLDITSVVSDNSEFTVTPSSGSLAPNNSMEFYITFAPADSGAETGNIIFTHSAPTSPDTVAVTGTGVADEAPEILSVIDIPDDQGGWVRLTWAASLLDHPGSTNPITQYGIWRRRDEEEKGLAAGEARNDLVILDIEESLEGWDAIGTVPAIQDSIYNFVAPTLGDSNAYGIYYSVFIITAHTQDPLVWFASDPDSGYSVDNIPPETPYNLAGEAIDTDVLLTWEIDLGHPDFSHFAVYRDTSSGFTPGTDNLIGTSVQATYTDSALAAGTYYYVVSALDVNGNESDYSNEVEATVPNIGVEETAGDVIPTYYALSQNYPNPFKAKTEIRYQLPQPGIVMIAIYDVSGRRINTLVNESKESGYHSITWNGQSQDGKQVSNGVYFCRMIAGEHTSVKKLLLTR